MTASPIIATEIPPEAQTITLEAKKKYSFCTCGKSKKLPYCDESHKSWNEAQKTCYASFKLWPQEKTTITVASKNWNKERLK